MAAPTVNIPAIPAGAQAAVLVAWDDANQEFVPVQCDANGKVETTATVATGDAPATGTITSVGDEVASTTVLAANANRKGATFYNDSTATLYLALANATASTTTYTVQIPNNGYYELPVCDGGVYTGIVVGIWASDAGGSVRVTELT